MEKKRVDSFDGLKGLAIMAVVAYHLFPSFIPGGFFMVNTFLVIAGFFFARNIEKIQAHTETINWKAIRGYFLKTIERLFIPLFWMLLLIVVGLFFFNPIELRYIRSDILSGLFFVNNIFQIIADRSYFVQMSNTSPFTHLWYNAIHLQSVVISMGIVLLLQRLRLSVPTKGIIWLFIVFLSHLVGVFLYQPGDDPTRVYYGIETRIASFGIGVATAYIVPTILNLFYKSKVKKLAYNLLSLISVALMFWIVFTQSDQSELTYSLWLSVFNVLSMVLIFSITAGAPIVTSWLSWRPLSVIGKRSYSFYLWYYPIIVFYMAFFRQLGGNIQLINLLSILTLAIVGEVFYRLIEQEKLKIWFGTSFNVLEDVEEIGHIIDERKFMQIKVFAFILYVALVTIFLRALVYSADNKRVALFELEYQLYQTKPNMLNTPYPYSLPIIEGKDNLENIDDLLSTSFISSPTFTDPVRTIQDQYFQTEELSAEIQELIAENQDVFDEVASTLEVAYDELSPHEILFATQVPMTYFGDSIALHSGPTMMNLFWNGNYYGQGSLQIWDAIAIVEEMIHAGEYQENAVFVLGTNAGLDQEAMDTLVELLGEERNIFFVNTNSRVPHIDEVNNIIAETADKYENVYEVDWYSLQDGHPEWYTEDEIHHTPLAMEYFTALVARTMYEEIGNQYSIQTNTDTE